MNTFEIMLLIAGLGVATAGITALWNALSLRRALRKS